MNGAAQLRALIFAAYDAVQAAKTTDEERELAAAFRAAKDHPGGAPRLDNGDEIARLSAEIDRVWDARQEVRDAAREAVDRVLEFEQLRALESIDLRGMRDTVLGRLHAELSRRQSVHELVDLLRRTDAPAEARATEEAA